MRRLVSYFSCLGAALLVAMAFNWWFDPFGHFYDQDVVVEALAFPQPCLISEDLLGTESWLRFKEDIFRKQEATTVVLGTSRSTAIHAWPGERGFANMSMPFTGAESLPARFQRVHGERPGDLTVYIGVEPFWFNEGWVLDAPFDRDPLATLESLLSRESFEVGLSRLRGSPGYLLGGRKTSAGGRCVLDRGSRVADGAQHAWDVDGSFWHRIELNPEKRTQPADDFNRDLVLFTDSKYRDWHELDSRRLGDLSEALSLAKTYGWEVVGFAPPFSTRYVRRLSSAPETAARWREYQKALPRLFARYGYPYLDLSSVRSVPCPEPAFVDDGWHINRSCSSNVRRLLDRAAADHEA